MSLNLCVWSSEVHCTVAEVYIERLAAYSGQCMFLMLFPFVIMLNTMESIQETFGISGQDKIIISVVSLFYFQPVYNAAMIIVQGENVASRAASAMTVYFITLLTFSINITYKYDASKTVPVVFFWFLIYVWAQIWAQRQLASDASAARAVQIFSTHCTSGSLMRLAV